MEWAFGLPRGGLWYYLRSKENIICRRCQPPLLLLDAEHALVRKDIREMFRRGDFVLAPTFGECARALDYLENPSIKKRDENDMTPRRPLTSVC